MTILVVIEFIMLIVMALLSASAISLNKENKYLREHVQGLRNTIKLLRDDADV